jgi:hypothetical protein
VDLEGLGQLKKSMNELTGNRIHELPSCSVVPSAVYSAGYRVSPVNNNQWDISSQSHVTTDGQSVSMSWCHVHCGTCDQMLYCVCKLLCCLYGAPSLTRGRVCLLSVTFISV